MGHDHSHESGHADSARSKNKSRLKLVLGLTGSYMVVEAVAGLMTHSLALLAEAAHMFTNVTRWPSRSSQSVSPSGRPHRSAHTATIV